MVERIMAPVEVCQSCGRCCNQISVSVALGDGVADLFKAHYGRDVDKARFLINHRCKHLTSENLCDLWDEDEALDQRPDICKEYMCERAKNPRMLVLDVMPMEV